MCSGFELLFLPGSGFSLSHRKPAGGSRGFGVQVSLLYTWDDTAVRPAVWTPDLRIYVSLWSYSGAALQASLSQDQKEQSYQSFFLYEIYHPWGVRYNVSDDQACSGLLQIYMSCRNPGSGNSVGGCGRSAAGKDRMDFFMEDFRAGGVFAAMQYILQGILQIFLSSGRDIFGV